MMDTGTFLISFILLFIIIFFILQYRESYMYKEREFQIKLKSAETARNAHILNMSYKDLMSVVDTNMVYYIDQAILVSGISNKESDEERSLDFNALLLQVCTNVEMSMSDSLKEAILFYISEEHLRTYIKDSSRILMIAKIEQKGFQNKNE